MTEVKDVKGVKEVKTSHGPAIICAAALLVTVACGGSPSSDTSSAPAASGSASAPSASSSSKVVPHETLLTFLPIVTGFTKGVPQGETDTAESVSRVQVNYEMKDSAGLSIEIMDTSRNQAMLEPMLAMIKPGYSQTQGMATTKATTVLGFPGYEEWAAESKNGTVGVLVEGRFTVAVTGSFVPDIATIRKLAEAIDLKKLATLK